jgi:hypothetical protein
MRALAIALFAVGFAAFTSQVAAQTISGESAAHEIELAERAWADALVSKDEQQLAALLDARFRLVMVGTSSSLSREEYLRQQSDSDRAYEAMTPTNIAISVNGDVAVAVVNMTVAWPSRFQERHPHWRFTDTWCLDDGEWRVVTRVSQPVVPS